MVKAFYVAFLHYFHFYRIGAPRIHLRQMVQSANADPLQLPTQIFRPGSEMRKGGNEEMSWDVAQRVLNLWELRLGLSTTWEGSEGG